MTSPQKGKQRTSQRKYYIQLSPIFQKTYISTVLAFFIKVKNLHFLQLAKTGINVEVSEE